jgi:triphosphoribosyl-dephospho-CoA synthase
MNSDRQRLERDQAAYLRACELDVLVSKPGNVSVDSAGHGMDAAMFMKAAAASVGPLFAPGASLGARVERAVDAARLATGCNTNLGIILLCAPLAAALQAQPAAGSPAALRGAVERIIADANTDDARAVYRAIAAANPGGLGHVPDQDVRNVPTVDLRSGMRIAAARDSIARQYSNGLADIFDLGLPRFERAALVSAQRAVLETFLTYLATWPDSHVARKHGAPVAAALSLAATRFDEAYARGAPVDPAELQAWNADLKSRGINPGTTADLVVATTFVFEALQPGG